MIRVLVVDDDKLVRKGLISSMPWQAFDMEVVGEASNGEAALEFMAQHRVDLLMVDLAMPVMSGIDLMRVVGQRYPGVYCVVLTFHQDFEYVQEALRLGAIDYIAKVQLEKEQFEEVLGRIRERIDRQINRGSTGELPGAISTVYLEDEALALISFSEQPAINCFQQLEMTGWELIEIDNELWLLTPAQDSSRAHGEKATSIDTLCKALLVIIAPQKNWTLLRLKGLKGENRNIVHRALRTYREKQLFYDFDPSVRLMHGSMAEISTIAPPVGEDTLLSIKEQWLKFKWVSSEPAFNQMLHALWREHIPYQRLIPLMVSIQTELSRLCDVVANLPASSLDEVHNWADLERWLAALRQQAMKVFVHQPYSDEVVGCVIEAMKIAINELDQPVTAKMVASRVNMSRSYFSQCFHDITGHPFNDYLRHIRMDRAKEYLLRTDMPIHWVAQRTGYEDEKYFSQVFREQTGALPSEFRKRNQNQPAAS